MTNEKQLKELESLLRELKRIYATQYKRNVVGESLFKLGRVINRLDKVVKPETNDKDLVDYLDKHSLKAIGHFMESA